MTNGTWQVKYQLKAMKKYDKKKARENQSPTWRRPRQRTSRSQPQGSLVGTLREIAPPTRTLLAIAGSTSCARGALASLLSSRHPCRTICRCRRDCCCRGGQRRSSRWCPSLPLRRHAEVGVGVGIGKAMKMWFTKNTIKTILQRKEQVKTKSRYA